MKNILGFIIFILVVVGFLVFFSGEDFPLIPQDSLHSGINDVTGCTECHAEEKKHPLKESHPPKYECFKCHKRGIK
jgi:hypothetical protein